MVYSPNKVVACIKVNGKVLRENLNAVTLPFGSEYSIFIKNLNPTRIKVRVSVDGTDATEGCWLVVDPNSELDLERFIKNGNMDKGNRFKFIERTEAVENGPRGIKAEDGLIRIEYQVEIVKPKPVVVEEHHHHHHHDHWDNPWDTRPWRPSSPWTLGGTYGNDDLKKSSPVRSSSSKVSMKSMRSLSSIDAMETSFMDTSATCDANVETLSSDADSILTAGAGAAASAPVSDIGITVAGSESNQSFKWVAGFATGNSEVIVIQLRGQIAGKVVTKAVTVETKLKCVTCGKTQKSTEKFCGQCGTALEII
jgi:hypothetical protein